MRPVRRKRRPPDAVDNQGRLLDDVTLDDISRQLDTVARRDANGPLELAALLTGN